MKVDVESLKWEGTIVEKTCPSIRKEDTVRENQWLWVRTNRSIVNRLVQVKVKIWGEVCPL